MKRLAYNTMASLFQQLVIMISGFILPRLYLEYFGSEANGLLVSVAQFLGLVSLLDSGMASVVSSALYQPLAERDYQKISGIVKFVQRFFWKLAVVVVFYCIAIAFFYPLVIDSDFDSGYIILLIFIMSVTTFSEYYLGMVNNILLNADQHAYIQLGINGMMAVLNLVLSIVLIKTGYGIHVVKLATVFLFLIRTVIIRLYIRRHYPINWRTEAKGNLVPQKWNGVAQHIAFIIVNNTDTVILSLFSTLRNVSVYAVYNLAQQGIKAIISSGNLGITPLMGNLLARKEEKLLKSFFVRVEWAYHTAVTFAFTVAGIMILPFVAVYTKGIYDADYHAPLFAVLLTAASAACCYRQPYQMMVIAGGHYKQTQVSSITEAVVNVIISVVCVFRFGLAGVAFGTLLAMAYRTVHLAYYLSRNLIYRPMRYFTSHMLVNITSAALMVWSTRGIGMAEISVYSWFIMALKVSGICLVEMAVINITFYRPEVKEIVRSVKMGISKRNS